jgi:nickel-dependent lactate racemase
MSTTPHVPTSSTRTRIPSSREECIVTIDRKSKPRVLAFGEDFLYEKLPVGTRVIYPPPPLDPLPDPDVAIRQAVLRPLGCDPLFAQLRPGMRVTIAIDDISLPLPPMQLPDVRQRILEHVVGLLTDYGVDDVHLVVATSLHRRMTPAEIKRMVGGKIFSQFHPDRLYNHDAEDPDGMVELGKTDHGEPVIISRRAAESDLVIYVNIDLVPMDGGHKSVAVGLTNYEGLKAHHDPDTIRRSSSYMDPSRSALSASVERMGRVVHQHLNVFQIETALNNNMYPPELQFLARNEDEWSAFDELKLKGMRYALSKLPRRARREMFMNIPARYGLTGVWAGRVEEVHQKALDKVFQQYSVPVKGQADILLFGVPFISPYNVNSILNPILVQVLAMGYLFNFYRGVPLVKKGGTIILTHPLPDEFHPEHHPSYIEFFHRCLADTRDSHELMRKYQDELARNPNYVHQYRYGNAYHGAHPFYMWYWGEGARQHVGQVIVAGAESDRVAQRLGWEAADTLRQAIDLARNAHGRNASITYLKLPPIAIADVEA